eukprot:1604779-Pyramimonas_sp.AAC.1
MLPMTSGIRASAPFAPDPQRETRGPGEARSSRVLTGCARTPVSEGFEGKWAARKPGEVHARW